MESKEVILSDEVISQAKKNVIPLIDFLRLAGYEITRDWKFTRENFNDLNLHYLHLTFERVQPKMQCKILVAFATKETDWHWSIDLSLYPYDEVSKSYFFNSVSSLDLVLEKYHPEVDRGFIQFAHSDDLKILSENFERSVQSWIQILSKELKQDISGENLRIVKHPMSDEYW